MTEEKKIPSLISAAFIFALFSLLIVLNMQRYQCNDLKNALLPQVAVSENMEQAQSQYTFSPKGLLLTEYQSILPANLPLAKRDRFTVQFRFLVDRFDGAFLTLGEKDKSETFKIDGKFEKGKYLTVTLIKQDDKALLQVNENEVAAEPFAGLTHPKLTIASLDSRLYLQSIEVLSDSGQPIYTRQFVPSLAGFWIAGIWFIIFFLCFLVLASVDKKLDPSDASATRILFFTTPVWAGTLIPMQVPSKAALLFCFSLSLVLFIFSWNRGRLEKLRFRVSIPLALMALSGMGEILFSLFPSKTAFFWLACSMACLFFTAWTMGQGQRNPISKGLGIAIAPLAIAALWPLAKMIGRLTANPLSGLDEPRRLPAAMLFAATLMLLQIFFSMRHRVAAYTPVALLLIFTGLGTAEMAFRHSALEPLLRPSETNLKLENDPFISLLRDANRDVSFRSGPTTKEPSEGKTRIMVLGGSTTYGFGVDVNKETFPGVLESCLNEKIETQKYEVINAGARGFNLFLLLRNLKNFGLSYHPDLIVLYINALDSLTLEGPLTLHELEKMNPASRKKLVNSWIDSSSENDAHSDKDNASGMLVSIQSYLSNIRLYQGLSHLVTKARSDPLHSLALWSGALKDINPTEDYRKNLKRVISLCKENKIDLLLVNEFDPFNESRKNPKRKILDSLMKEEAQKAGLAFFDIQGEFLNQSDGDGLFFNQPNYQYHYNLKGHRKVGERLCSWIIEHR